MPNNKFAVYGQGSFVRFSQGMVQLKQMFQETFLQNFFIGASTHHSLDIL